MTGTAHQKLGELVRCVSGGTPSRKVPGYFAGDIPWITGADIGPDCSVTAREHVTADAIRGSAAQVVPAGTVLLVTRTSVGKVGCADLPLAFSQDVTALLHDPDRVETRFLIHFLRSKQSFLAAQARGATIKGVTREVVAALEVPLPPLEEQRRIAAILDQADALRAKRKEGISHVGALRKAAIDWAFADSGGSRWTPIGDVARVQIGPFGSLLHQEDYTDGGIPLVNPMHIVDGEIRTDSRQAVTQAKHADLVLYHLRKGDVVLGRRGEMGRAAVVSSKHEGILCGTGSLVIRCADQRLNPYYLQAVLASARSRRRLEAVALGATLPNLNRKIVEAFEIPVPPFEAQEEFAATVQSLDAVRSSMRGSLHALDSLFDALVARAFSGRL